MGGTNELVNRAFVTDQEAFATVDKSASFSAFGDTRVSRISPQAGWSFANGINDGNISQTVTGSGSVTNGSAHATLSTGTTTGSKARIQTIKTLRYVPGEGGVFRVTCPFGTPSADGYQKVGIFTDVNGWGIGYNGTSFGFFRTQDSTTTWYPQEEWNGEEYPFIDPSKGIPWEFSFQWLGYGAQKFKASLPDGRIITLHTIEYANQFTEVSVFNPNLPLAAEVYNGAGTDDVTLKTPSAMAGVDGDAYNEANSVDFATGVSADGITGTNFPLITLRNPVTWNGMENNLPVQALRVTFAAESNKPVTFKIWVGATLTGGTFSPLYPTITSIEQATDVSSISGGVLIGYHPVGKSGNLQIDLSVSKFISFPGQTFVFTADTVGVITADVRCGVHLRQFL